MQDVALFVLGYCIQCVAALLLMYKIQKQKSIYGLSVDTQIGFFIANISRCIWTLDTRLVETTSAYLELICSTISSCVVLYLCYKYYYTTTKHATPLLRIY